VWQSRFGVGKKGIIHDFAVVFDVSRCWLSGIEGGCGSVIRVLPVTVVLTYDAKLMQVVEQAILIFGNEFIHEGVNIYIT
jgi:hypothetical protein